MTSFKSIHSIPLHVHSSVLINLFQPHLNKQRAKWKLAGRRYKVDLGDVIPEEPNAVGFMLRWAAFIEMSVSPAPTHPDLPFNSCSPAPPTAPPVSSADFISPKGLLTSSASKTNTTVNHFHPVSASFSAVCSAAHRSKVGVVKVIVNCFVSNWTPAVLQNLFCVWLL